MIPLCSYQRYLDAGRRRHMLRCLEFGLVSRVARQCVSALTVASLEMPDATLRQLPSVLLRLSQISPTTSMAVPVLEFLSTLVRLPKLFSNFVEDQYLSVFAIALPYTNPKRFNHFAVSLAYTVIILWYIKCRAPFRKGFVSFITKALKANIQEEVADKRTLTLSTSNPNISALSPSTTTTTTTADRAAVDRKESAPGREMFLPLDLKLHTELIECCVDLMARYAHSYFSLLPHRSPVAEFLLKGRERDNYRTSAGALLFHPDHFFQFTFVIFPLVHSVIFYLHFKVARRVIG